MKSPSTSAGRAIRVGRGARPALRLGTRGRPEESRAAILQAAIAEFAEHGIAGARTDAIAHVARVNKALLYYYFKDKDALYEAVLREALSNYRDLATLARAKGTLHVQHNTLPWHIATAVRGQELLSYIL